MIRKVYIYFHANWSFAPPVCEKQQVGRCIPPLDERQFQFGRRSIAIPNPPDRGGRNPDNLETTVCVGERLTWRLLWTRVRSSVCRPPNGTTRALLQRLSCWGRRQSAR